MNRNHCKACEDGEMWDDGDENICDCPKGCHDGQAIDQAEYQMEDR